MAPPFKEDLDEPLDFYKTRHWDPVDEAEEEFQAIYAKHGNGIEEHYFDAGRDGQVLRRYLQEQQLPEDKIELVLRRLAKWGTRLRFQTSFGPRDYSEAISRLNLQSSKIDIQRFNDRKDSMVDSQRPMSVRFRVGDKTVTESFDAYGDLQPDMDFEGGGPQQNKMLDQPGVSDVQNVGAFRIGGETYIAIGAGPIRVGEHLLLWLLDRQRFAVVHDWERGGDGVGQTDMFMGTKVPVSFALISGNPFGEEGAVLEDIRVTDFHCECVGIQPERGIHAAPIPDVWDAKNERWEK